MGRSPASQRISQEKGSRRLFGTVGEKRGEVFHLTYERSYVPCREAKHKIFLLVNKLFEYT